MQIVNPATGSLIKDVATDTEWSLRDKFERARRAQTAWALVPYAERQTRIARFAELVEREERELAETLTREVGKPLSQSMNELNAFKARIRFFLEHAGALLEPEVVHSSASLTETIGHEPLGVIANISAWNYPYFVGGNVFLPALLTGNAVLYKPSEFATLSGLNMARLLHQAGVPEHIFASVVGGPEVGRSCLEQPVSGIFFTGSVATGKEIARAAAERLVVVGLELGGKDPAYACEDVDVAAAAAQIADGAFYNAGQSCCAVERVYVHRAIYPEFLAAFTEAARALKLGDPMLQDTTLGPLTRGEPQLAHLEAQLNDAASKGARVVSGGARVPGPGHFFEPTVVVDVDHSMALMTEETFGPVIGLMPVDNDEQALELMNDTDYGLTASVYTRDRERARRMLARLDVGSAYWNCCDRVSPALPWSGRRHSGLGTTLSTYGIRAFTAPKAWHERKP